MRERAQVNLATYANGRRLRELGVASGGDMTHEAAVTKLAYLLGKGLSPDVVKRYMEMPLRGEMSVQGST
jgi:L-asparaginase